jgi:hypothetical protein
MHDVPMASNRRAYMGEPRQLTAPPARIDAAAGRAQKLAAAGGILALACLGYGTWLVWRARRIACDEDAACSRPLPNRVVTIALVAATLLVAAAVAFDFLAPLILT